MNTFSGAHIFGVVRHAERADAAFAVQPGGGPRWTRASDAQMWPFDPPITEEGKHAAGEAGIKIQAFADECGTKIDIILCSPYTRCVQTASAIASKLRPACRILIDHSVGEIFGPAIMSQSEPTKVVRPLDGALPSSVRRKQLLGGGSKVIGTWPTWPEDPRSARQRFANRFLTHLQRSMSSKRNFLLVTHADCVGAALSVMPSHADCVVEKIDYCGMFLARRLTGEAPPIFSQLNKFLQATPEDEGEGGDAADEAIIQQHKAADKAAELENTDVPDHSWQVRTFGIKAHRLNGDGPNTANASVFEKRTKALEKNTKMSPDKIRFLLGTLTDRPLGDRSEEFSMRSHMSGSTLLFNKSGDAASSQSQGSGSLHNSNELTTGGLLQMAMGGMKGGSPPASSSAPNKPVEEPGADSKGEGKEDTQVKCCRLNVCKEILRLELKGTDSAAPQTAAPPVRPPTMNATMNSLLQRRGNAAVGSLKLSL